MEPFQLTMSELPARPFQFQVDGQWHACTAQRVRSMLELGSRYPDDDWQRVLAGYTVHLPLTQRYVRRTPSQVMQRDQARQVALF